MIWSDEAGRGGIRFSAIPQSSRRILKEWLFANLLIACSNHVARTEQLARRKNDEETSPEPPPVHEPANVVPISNSNSNDSGILSPVEAVHVEAVRMEAREIGDNVDAVLQLITDRARNLTGASGAALALLTPTLLISTVLTHDKMICRAQAGEPAPPLGAPVDVSQGLSGECVRNGLLV